MAVQIQWRRDTAANWTSEDPILAEGEAGLETDTNQFKLGDGSTAWTGLAYAGGGGAVDAEDVAVDSTTLVGTGTDVQAVLEELDNGIADHLADSTAAHAASAISASSTTLVGVATDVQGVLEELDDSIADHLADSSAAHAASAISANSATLVGVGTDVQAVLEELDNGIADHLADSSAAHAASAISVSSATLVGTGTDVQAVFEELDDAIAANTTAISDHLADTVDAHDASAISIVDAGNDFTATTVEGALDELQADNEAHVAAADPHTVYILESLLDAKGDLISASADNTPVRIAGPGSTLDYSRLRTRDGATGGMEWGERYFAKILAADYSRGNNVAGMADVTGMNITLPSGLAIVWFEFTGFYQSNNTAMGCNVSMNAGGGTMHAIKRIETSATGPTYSEGHITALDGAGGATTSVDSANTSRWFEMKGYIISPTGVLTCRWSNETNTGSQGTTIMAGAVMKVWMSN